MEVEAFHEPPLLAPGVVLELELELLLELDLHLYPPSDHPRFMVPMRGRKAVEAFQQGDLLWLVTGDDLGHYWAVQLADLRALQSRDAAAWDETFRWLWPVAFGVAQTTLQPYLPGDVEDVAIESLEELVGKVPGLRSFDELKPLVAAIAHNRAVSRLRRHFAAIRGAGQTESLEGRQQERGDLPEAIAPDDPVAALEQKELAQRLRQLLAELRPPQGEILSDYFLHGLSHQEIATKRGVPLGTVGVYLKRGLAALRRLWGPRGKNM